MTVIKTFNYSKLSGVLCTHTYFYPCLIFVTEVEARGASLPVRHLHSLGIKYQAMSNILKKSKHAMSILLGQLNSPELLGQ